MCDGTYTYPTKGGAPIIVKRPTIIIMSNLPPEEVYHGENIIKYLKARFIVTQLHWASPIISGERRKPRGWYKPRREMGFEVICSSGSELSIVNLKHFVYKQILFSIYHFYFFYAKILFKEDFVQEEEHHA